MFCVALRCYSNDNNYPMNDFLGDLSRRRDQYFANLNVYLFYVNNCSLFKWTFRYTYIGCSHYIFAQILRCITLLFIE